MFKGVDNRKGLLMWDLNSLNFAVTVGTCLVIRDGFLKARLVLVVDVLVLMYPAVAQLFTIFSITFEQKNISISTPCIVLVSRAAGTVPPSLQLSTGK